MTNKYETGIKDEYGNREFDFRKAFADLKQVVLGKKKMTKDLYEVMYLRFTIAHYNMWGWMHTYNGNWGELADEIESVPYGGFDGVPMEVVQDIKDFLYEHNSDYAMGYDNHE